MKKLLFAAIAILGFSAVSFGQPGNTATATVGGTIITPITITKNADMNFGTVLASAAGTVVLIPGVANPTYTGVSHYGGLGTVAPSTAQFTVNGNFSNAYSISVTNLPTTVVNGGATMAVGTWTMATANNFSYTGATGSGSGTLSASGVQTFEIGATLTVAAGQTAGTYTAAAPINIIVNYN